MTTTSLPPLPRAHVARPRLAASVRPDTPVVCVIAGAGWGKSVLLRELAAQAAAAGRSVAWLDLDRGRAAAPRFWQSLVRSIAAAVPEGSDRDGLTALLGSFRPTVDIDQLLGSLIGELTDLTASGRSLTVVVDDAHLINDQQVRTGFASFADRIPDGVQLIVGSRVEPSFPLSAWRLRGRVDEVRESHLRYTADEAGRLVAAMLGRPVADDVVAALVDETEGWPAGVQLHALAARGAGDRSIEHVRQQGRHLSHEYLLEEVLATLPAHLRRFVLDTSALDVLTESACRAVIGDDHPCDPRAVLDELEHSGVFTTRLDPDGRRFRYHHLFRELLQTELARTDRERWELVHRRAANHLVAEGDILEAVDHLLDVADPAAALRVLAENHRRVLESRALLSLAPRVTRFPPSFARADPATALEVATLTGISGRFSAAAHLVAPLRHVPLEPALEARRTWIDLSLSAVVGDVERVVALLGTRPTVPPDDLVAGTWREIPLSLLLFDRFDEAADEWERGCAEGLLESTHPHVGLSIRAFMAAWSGRLEEAARLVDQAQDEIDETKGIRASFLRIPCAASLVRMQQGDPVAAAQVMERFLTDLGGALERHTTYDVPLAVTALRAWRLAGEPWRAFDGSVPLVDSLPGMARPWLMSLVAEELVRCACDLGDVAAAERALGQVRGELAGSLARAHVLLVRGETVAARTALAGFDRTLVARHSPARALDLAALQHLTATTSRDLADSSEFATALAAEHGLTRSLDVAVRRSPRTASSAPSQTPVVLPDPLSAREFEVLRLLPTDLPNAELARELFVSLNTLKTHMKSVYRKLGATGRTDAVRRARELGLLPRRTT